MLRITLFLFSAIAFSFFMMACGSESSSDQQPGPDEQMNTDATVEVITPLEETEWHLVSLRGEEVVLSEESRGTPYIAFYAEESRVSGNAGCNQFSGGYELGEAGGLSFGNIAATKMMCADMSVEDRFMGIMQDVAGFTITGDRLILMSRTGERLAEFEVASV